MSEAVLRASGLRPRASGWIWRLRLAATARFDDLRLALDSLSGHKLRSGLTLLGIVIGVFTVVAMIALLNGLSETINQQLGALGADSLRIQLWPAVQFGNFSLHGAAPKKIMLAHCEAQRAA